MERLMLLDGYGLVYRGYFALPPLTTSKGELVNGVFGFASIVLRGIAGPPARLPRGLVRPPGPDLPPRAVRRVQGHPQRMPDDLRDQFPKVREVVKALRIPVYEMAGYEADDVIGTITQQLEPNEDLETTIVTGRPRHAPARHAARPAHDDALRASRTRSCTTSPGSTSGSACGPTR